MANNAIGSLRPDAVTAVHNHAGEHLIAAYLVGYGGDPRRPDQWMFDQHFLDLHRGDVLAAAADHVLLAVHEVQQAVGIEGD